MAARAQNFVCQNCGAAFPRWAGKCEACGEWNTLVEEGAEGGRRASVSYTHLDPGVNGFALNGANTLETGTGGYPITATGDVLSLIHI